ncbi:MAG: 1-deoxy-D-xylulose-5-phosphate reductoisomerase [Oligoflexia bacterium]|nr:1-deoxy-D-xylulose-5-phosphate reductoisomerase [Oligoflexia bacterium]
MLASHSVPKSRFDFARRTRVAVLGSTGSIGTAALELIEAHSERFELVGIAAGSNAQTLSEQAGRYRPRRIALASAPPSDSLQLLHQQAAAIKADLEFGVTAVDQLASEPGVDLVIAAISGSAGLSSTFAALESGKIVALANKESLVCAGELAAKILEQGRAVLLPVDSEHSAIFQALQGERPADISRILLTASGGPFLDLPLAEFASITPERALKHPRWKMGPKVTIDSATMMNKALEVIEAFWLFGVTPLCIDVLVHPQSIVHSLVEFKDGSQIAQLSNPDMHGPIGFALSYPFGRLNRAMSRLNLLEVGQLQFRPLDDAKFPYVGMARSVLKAGGSMPMVFNAANEVAVERFLKGSLGFDRIRSIIEESLGHFSGLCYTSLRELIAQERQVREFAAALSAGSRREL